MPIIQYVSNKVTMTKKNPLQLLSDNKYKQLNLNIIITLQLVHMMLSINSLQLLTVVIVQSTIFWISVKLNKKSRQQLHHTHIEKFLFPVKPSTHTGISQLYKSKNFFESPPKKMLCTNTRLVTIKHCLIIFSLLCSLDPL